MTQLARLLAVVVALALATATLTALGLLVHGPRTGPPSWRVVGQVVVLCAAWLLTNSPYEGRVLWIPLPDHGLTVADLAVVPPLLAALAIAGLQLRS